MTADWTRLGPVRVRPAGVPAPLDAVEIELPTCPCEDCSEIVVWFASLPPALRVPSVP